MVEVKFNELMVLFLVIVKGIVLKVCSVLVGMLWVLLLNK